jgi:hypothetical protein
MLTNLQTCAIIHRMSTLAEIEAAADSLSAVEKEELLRFLAIRLRRERPLPTPRIYSDEELAAMLAEDEADGAGLRQGS